MVLKLKGITADWQHLKEMYLETFLTQYTIQSYIRNKEKCLPIQVIWKPNILSYIKIKRMEWFGQVWRATNDIRKVLMEIIHSYVW